MLPVEERQSDGAPAVRAAGPPATRRAAGGEGQRALKGAGAAPGGRKSEWDPHPVRAVGEGRRDLHPASVCAVRAGPIQQTPRSPGLVTPPTDPRPHGVRRMDTSDVIPPVAGTDRDRPAAAGLLSPAERAIRLAQVAERIRQLELQHGRGGRPACSTGLAELDAALGGGLRAGAVHELVGEVGGAAALVVALRVAARATLRSGWLIYVDSAGDFYPPGAEQRGVALGRLLVVRPTGSADALWATEQALRCRAVGAVVLPVRRLEAAMSRRLQLAAESGGGLGLIVRPDPQGEPTFAATRLRVTTGVGRPGGVRLRIEVLKQVGGRPGAAVEVEWPDAADPVSASAVPADGAGAARRRLG